MRQTYYRPLKGIHGQRNGKYFYKVNDTKRKHPYIRKGCQACGKQVMMKVQTTAQFCSKSCSQKGDHNSLWKGKLPVFVGTRTEYVKCHQNVRKQRGNPLVCERASDTCKGQMEWCNISGDYYNVNDFVALCRSHHIRWDSTKGGE